MAKAQEDQEHQSPVTVDEKNKTIFLIGDIDEESAAKFIPAVYQLDPQKGATPLTIRLATNGGDVSLSLAMYDALKNANSDVKIVGMGMVYSAGALIIQAANNRLLTPNASFMVHEFILGAEGTMASVLPQIRFDSGKLFETYINIIAERSKIPLRKLRRLFRDETYFTAEEAVEIGLVDGIESKEQE